MNDSNQTDNIYKKPDSELTTKQTPSLDDALLQSRYHQLKGLRGWLLLVGCGIIIQPFRMGLDIYNGYFANGSWDLLTDPTSSIYKPFFGIIIIAESFINMLFVLVGLYLIYLFFSKHYKFPKIFILFIAANALFISAESWFLAWYLDIEFFDKETIKLIASALFYCAIWIPYMRISKRVRVTFVEHKPG